MYCTRYVVFSLRSTGKWYTSVEQPHDEIHLAIGGQDHQPIKAEVKTTYDKFGDPVKSTKGMSAQVRTRGFVSCRRAGT